MQERRGGAGWGMDKNTDKDTWLGGFGVWHGPGLQCRMDSMTGPVGDWGRIFRIWWLTEWRARPQDGAQISGQMTRPMTPVSGPQDQEQVWGGMSSVWTW